MAKQFLLFQFSMFDDNLNLSTRLAKLKIEALTQSILNPIHPKIFFPLVGRISLNMKSLSVLYSTMVSRSSILSRSVSRRLMG